MYTGDERGKPSERVQSEFIFDPENPVYGKPGDEESQEYDESEEEIVTDDGRDGGSMRDVNHTLEGKVSVQGTMERGPETEEENETIADGAGYGMPVAGFATPPSYDETEETSSMGEFPM